MRFGAFIAPFHRPDGRPTDALERDLALVERLEDLGYDEAWFGEHHSGGWETIGSPELMIAAAAQRTTRIRLGTGVVSLPYHHPLTVADRILMLDHLTRGRLLFGVGSGALEQDARMMGFDPAERAARLEERLEAVTALLSRAGPVTRTGRGFELRAAMPQLAGYRGLTPPLYVASSFAGAGLRLAGRHRAGLLLMGLGAAAAPRFRDAAAAASAAGCPIDRSRLMIVLNVHVAESRTAAVETIKDEATAEQYEYWNAIVGLPMPDYPPGEHVDRMIERGLLLAGSPGDIVDALRRLTDAIGAIGGVLVAAREWADPVATDRSHELFAREVMPALTSRNSSPGRFGAADLLAETP